MKIDCAHRLAIDPDYYPGKLIVSGLSCDGLATGRVQHSDKSFTPLVEQRDGTTVNKRPVHYTYSEILRSSPNCFEEVFFLTSASWLWHSSRCRFRPLFYCLKVCFKAKVAQDPGWSIQITKQTQPFTVAPLGNRIDLHISLKGGGRNAFKSPRPSRYEKIVGNSLSETFD